MPRLTPTHLSHSNPLRHEAAGSRGWHQGGFLPHRDEPGLVQFVTFRLADACPAAWRSEWGALLAIEDNLQRIRKLEGHLDLGRGESHLRRPELAGLVEDALRHFHGERYELHARVIMPIYVPVLFTPTRQSMGDTLRNWK
jgi:putative transposase